MIFKDLCVLVLWTKVTSALETGKVKIQKLSPGTDSCSNIFVIENDFTKYLKEKCWLCFH